MVGTYKTVPWEKKAAASSARAPPHTGPLALMRSMYLS